MYKRQELEVAPRYGEGRGLKPLCSRDRSLLATVAPLYGEGRGLKQARHGEFDRSRAVAPLYGEGRGLKPRRDVTRGAEAGVAPLYGEGRGLKLKGGHVCVSPCLLYPSDAADQRSRVDLGGRRIINKQKPSHLHVTRQRQHHISRV